METCISSLPTSTAAALGSINGICGVGVVIILTMIRTTVPGQGPITIKSFQREAYAHQSIRVSLTGTNLSNEQPEPRARHMPIAVTLRDDANRPDPTRF